MAEIISRDPHDPLIIAEQDRAMQSLQDFVAEPPDYGISREEAVGQLTSLAGFLQPAIEGWARRAPILATHYVEGLSRYYGGKAAYQTWMERRSPEFSERDSELYVISGRVALVVSMQYDGESSIRSMAYPINIQNSITDTYHTPHRLSFSRDPEHPEAKAHNPFFLEGEMITQEGVGVYTHQPFRIAQREVPETDVDGIAHHLDHRAAQVYQQGGELAFLRHNVHELLTTFYEDLHDLRLLRDHQG